MLHRRSDRIILKTIDGKTVVRPELKDGDGVQFSDRVVGWLNEEGVQAWNSGEEIYWFHCHAMGDLRGLLNAEF